MRSLSFSLVLLTLMSCGDDGGGGTGRECLTVKTLRAPTVTGAKVTADFSVTTCKGDPVAGLVFPGNFEIDEAGKAISSVSNMPKIDSSPQNFKVYTLMLVDVNMGIRSTDPDLATVRASVKSFAATVLASGSNRLVAVYAFDGRKDIQKLSDFTGDLSALNTTIDMLLTCNNTMICVDPSSNLNGAIVQGLAALNTARAAGETGGGLTAGTLAVFTDGVDRAGLVTTSTALNAIKSSENKNAVFTIAFESDQQDLTALKEYGKDGFASAANLENLAAEFAKIADRVNGFANSNYRLQYCTLKRTGKQDLEVKVTYTDADKVAYIGFLSTNFTATSSFECNIQ